MDVCCCVAPSPFCSCSSGYIYNSMFPATHYRLPPRRISSHTDINTHAYQYINVSTYTDTFTGDDLITLSTSPNTYISNAVDEHNIVKCQMSGGCRDKKPLLGEGVKVNTHTPTTPKNIIKVESCTANINTPLPTIPKNTTSTYSCSPDIYYSPTCKNPLQADLNVSYFSNINSNFYNNFSPLPSHTSCFPGEVTGYFAT